MIFGTLAPRYRYSTTDVDLDYAQIIEDGPVHLNLRHESVINGHRAITHKGYHWAFTVRLNLWKYGSPKVKWTTIYGHLYKSVTLWRHRDQDAFKDANGDVVLFYIKEIIPYYINKVDFQDYIDIKFFSVDYVDVSKSTVALLYKEDGVTPIITEDGQGIILG